MKVYHNIDECSAIKPVVTMGMFDGVHRGHTSVLQKVKQTSQFHGGESVVITFWPHPRKVLGKDNSLRFLNSLQGKMRRIQEVGIDHLIIIPFTKEFAKLSSCEFIKQYLVNKVKIHHLIIGFNHQFGRNREGNYENLAMCAKQYGFTIERLPAAFINDDSISSSNIRQALNDGNVQHANKMLGYTYRLKGKVVGGNRIGTNIGFPTANIKPYYSEKLLPKVGVYAVNAIINEKEYKGMLNIGLRPTIYEEHKELSIEVHLFDFHKNIYDNDIEVRFVHRIRDEQKFGSIDELVEQLKEDQVSCLQVLK